MTSGVAGPSGFSAASDFPERPRIVTEHPDFYVIAKPARWLTHPVRARVDVPDVLTFLQRETGEEKVAPPHRLDRETSGAQIFTRDSDSARRFFTLFKEHLIGKSYLAIVHGSPEWDETVLDAPLGFVGLSESNHIQIRQGVVPDVLSFLQRETGEEKVAPPHRLDRETSGAQIFTRDSDSARRFFTLFKEHLIGKSYLAIVHGSPEWDETVLDAPLGFVGLSESNHIQIRQGVVPDGKPAATEFRVVARKPGFSLLHAFPRSGRLHQIRAHLSHLGLPMVGDKIYGRDPDVFLDFMQTGQTDDLTRRLLLPRQALHAHSLSFGWDRAKVRVEVPLAADLQAFWDELPTD